MKKIISSITALILLAAMSLSAFAETTGIYSDFNLSEECPFLTLTDAISGYEDGTFRPDNTITRAEFIKCMTIIYEGSYGEQEKAEINFSDLKKTHWAYDDIAKAVNIGFVSGYEDGTFRPDDTITYEQAITMIFTLLGYAPIAEMYGGYPTAFMSFGYYGKFFKTSIKDRAYQIEMNDSKAKTAVTRRDAAKMMHLMLFYPICEVTEYVTLESGDGLIPKYILGDEGELTNSLYTKGYVGMEIGD